MTPSPSSAARCYRPLPLLSRCRRPWTGWLQVVAASFMILSPLPSSLASWTDTNSDGNNDTWTDPNTNQVTTLADLNLQNSDADNDGATNDEEAAEGSDPFSFDTDYDGISDGDELHIVKPLIGTSLTDWDSDDDWISDYDEWYNFSGVTYSGGQLPGFTGASYSDYDGDGFKNPADPFPSDPNNYSSINGYNWYSAVLGDSDSDGILNWEDSDPNNPPQAPDADSDGIPDSSDPFPQDASNYSAINGSNWYGDVLGNNDSDSLLNYQDPFPSDATNYSTINNTYWHETLLYDNDSDGLPNYLDPFPNDATNYSAINNTVWNGAVSADNDSDGIVNYNDPFPSDPSNYSSINSYAWGSFVLGDYDSDGIVNYKDPYSSDATNTSSVNNISWNGDVLGDADSDGTPNWQDPQPYGTPDTDSDGIPDNTDPFPNDANNYAPVNGIAWYGDVFGDADGDGVLNWEDPTPQPPLPPDGDGDSIPDASDPYPTDNANHSNINNITWYTDVNGDNDNDGILNWTDPYPSDATNFCALNNTAWYANVLNDDDTDGYPNWQDYNPSPYIDQDGDGIPNGQDPYYLDNTNFSSTNGIMWYQDVLGDLDSDGILNWADAWPEDPLNDPDRDGDGLKASAESSYGTSDLDVDCDDDGLTDYEELIVYHTNPLNAHHLSQALGWGDLYTDYQLIDSTDTDQDTIPDRIEIFYGMLPNNIEDGYGDLDGNGINNMNQYAAGLALDVDLTLYDQDGDGMTDVFEDYYGLNKTYFADSMMDADGDGVLNFEEAKLLFSPLHANSRDIEGLTDLYFLAFAMLYPQSPPEWVDENNNNLPDWYDEALVGMSPVFTPIAWGDLDGDGMPDTWEHQFGRWKFPSSGLYVRHDDSAADPDADSLTNLQEYQLGTNPLIADSNGDGTSDGNEDDDGDGLSNATEVALGLNPGSTDTDGDGMDDHWEHTYGTNALTNDAYGNLDGDSLTNEEEYQNNLNPQDGADELVWQVYTRARQGTAEPWGFESFDPANDPKRYKQKTYSGAGILDATASDSSSEYWIDGLDWHSYEQETSYSRTFDHVVEWTEEPSIPIMTGYIASHVDPMLPSAISERTAAYNDDESAETTYENNGHHTWPLPEDWYSNGQEYWHEHLAGTYEGDGTDLFSVTGAGEHTWAMQDSDAGNSGNTLPPTPRQKYVSSYEATVPLDSILGDWHFHLDLNLTVNNGTSTEWQKTRSVSVPSTWSSTVAAAGNITELWTLSEPISVEDILDATREDLALCPWTDWTVDMEAYVLYQYYEDNGYAKANAYQREYYIKLETASGATLTGIKPRTYKWLEGYLPQDGELEHTPRETTLSPGEQSQVFILDPMEKDPQKGGEMILFHPGTVDLDVFVPNFGTPESAEEEPGALIPATVDPEAPLTSMLAYGAPEYGTFMLKFPSSLRIWRDAYRQQAVASEEEFTVGEPVQFFVEFTAPAGAGPQPSTVELIWRGGDPLGGNGPDIELKDTVKLLPLEYMTKGENNEMIPVDFFANGTTAPVIEASLSNLSVSPTGQVNLTISGTVRDSTSDLIDLPSKQIDSLNILVPGGQQTIGLQNSEVAPELPWKPYKWKAQLSENVSFQVAGPGTYTVTLVTEKNAGGLAASSSAVVEVRQQKLTIEMPPDSPTTVDTLRVYSETSSGGAEELMTETTALARIFKFAPNPTTDEISLEILEPVSFSPTSPDTLEIRVRTTFQDGSSSFRDYSLAETGAATGKFVFDALVAFSSGGFSKTEEGFFFPIIARFASDRPISNDLSAGIMSEDWTIQSRDLGDGSYYYPVDAQNNVVVFNPQHHARTHLQTKFFDTAWYLNLKNAGVTIAASNLEQIDGLLLKGPIDENLIASGLVTGTYEIRSKPIAGHVYSHVRPRPGKQLAMVPLSNSVTPEILWRYVASKNRIAYFSSLDMLRMDLSFRNEVVKAARTANFAYLGDGFSTKPAKWNPQIWTATAVSSYQNTPLNVTSELTEHGKQIGPFHAIQDVFTNPENDPDYHESIYAFACQGGARMVWARGLSLAMGKLKFNNHVGVAPIKASTGFFLRQREVPVEDSFWIPGDWGFLRNTGYDPMAPGMENREGENVIYLGGSVDTQFTKFWEKGQFWGHGFGISNLRDMIGELEIWALAPVEVSSIRMDLRLQAFEEF